MLYIDYQLLKNKAKEKYKHIKNKIKPLSVEAKQY